MVLLRGHGAMLHPKVWGSLTSTVQRPTRTHMNAGLWKYDITTSLCMFIFIFQYNLGS
jgi:hypothetical protein